MCKEEKSIECFAKKRAAKDGRQSRCNPCMSKTMLVIYNKDRPLWNEKDKKAKAKKRNWVNELKSQCGCKFCGEKESICLEFHHLDPNDKENDIAVMISNKASNNRLLKEIEKCIVVCANCHRKIHAGIITNP